MLLHAAASGGGTTEWSRHLSKLTLERKHGALRPQKPLRLIKDGEVVRSGIIYLTPTRYTVTTRMILH